MNIIVKAVQDAMYVIPEEILRETFIPSYNNYRAPAQTMESLIISTVINPRVVPDLSIAKGEHMSINISSVRPKIVDDFRAVYEIPASLTAGKKILSVLNVAHGLYDSAYSSYGLAYGGMGMLQANDAMTAATQIVEASSSVPNVSTARVELIGENTVMIEDSQRMSGMYRLECYVVNDNYMNQIDPRYYEYFSQLCEFAIKAHIFRKLRIRMGRARIEGGSNLAEFKEVVDEYADAETNYRTWLKEKMAKVLFMNESSRYRRFIRSQIPIGL